MKAGLATKLVRAGNYLAEVEVELIFTEGNWSPYLSAEDACRLDDVRHSLEHGDIQAAQRLAKVFILTPVAV